MTRDSLEDRYRLAYRDLSDRGQSHVLRWWPELESGQKDRLLGQIESIPWEVLEPILPTHVLQKPDRPIPEGLEPAPVHPRHPDPPRAAAYEQAERTGRALMERGAVAAFTVAGGQASRLGVSAPKGTIPVTPAGDRSLFGLFADMVAAARARYGAAIPWYIMTSEANHTDTVAFFREHGFFDLPADEVVFFRQGMLPAFGGDGRILLDRKDSLALAPDGHGGSLKAMVRSGAIEDMRRRGVELISYFQVDNPLVKPFDPLFLGLHREHGSEMSTKVAKKADDLERVGNVCMQGGRLSVIEYSEFPEALARARLGDGSRKFDAANLAIHLLDVDFVARIAGESFQLPFRRADKAVPFVNEEGERVVFEEPNAVKLETFIFDALPLARNPLLLEAARAEEFSPVKNATGKDSLETSMRDQVRRAARWLAAAGVSVPTRPDGEPDVAVAISPRFAMDEGELRRKRDRIPPLHSGARVYIE